MCIKVKQIGITWKQTGRKDKVRKCQETFLYYISWNKIWQDSTSNNGLSRKYILTTAYEHNTSVVLLIRANVTFEQFITTNIFNLGI